jgi:4-hydroxysphinganine ceramide fatty acyl 2-hydroxylase
VTFLRHGSNGVLVAAIIVLTALFAVRVVPFWIIPGIIGAAIFFGSEYTTHRFLFHAKPVKLGWLNKLQHLLHYDHHIDPPKLELLFLPLWFVIPVAALYYGVYLLIVRDPIQAISFMFGAICALTYYEWVHYVAHVPITPITPLGKYMKKYHLWHHFKNEHYWYGVTNPSMDFVGFSYRDVETAERSTTVREIWKGMDA